jgi:xanthine/uracil permease
MRSTIARNVGRGWMQMISFVLGMIVGGAVAVLFLVCFRMEE